MPYALIGIVCHHQFLFVVPVPLSTNSLGLLVRVVAVLGLQLLHESDVLLLGLLDIDTLIDLLLPCVLLCLALFIYDPVSAARVRILILGLRRVSCDLP